LARAIRALLFGEFFLAVDAKTKPVTKADNIQTIRKKLHGVQLRVSQPRIAVLQRLQVAMEPMSHAEVADDLAERGFDRGTIYRNLVELAEVGLVSRLDVGDHLWRFEILNVESQIRFFCESCGTVSRLPGISIEKGLSSTVRKAIKGTLAEILLKGRCDACN
jgi:Fur family ferric uptake transcriptional regulator